MDIIEYNIIYFIHIQARYFVVVVVVVFSFIIVFERQSGDEKLTINFFDNYLNLKNVFSSFYC